MSVLLLLQLIEAADYDLGGHLVDFVVTRHNNVCTGGQPTDQSTMRSGLALKLRASLARAAYTAAGLTDSGAATAAATARLCRASV